LSFSMSSLRHPPTCAASFHLTCRITLGPCDILRYVCTYFTILSHVHISGNIFSRT
jgi:hypothetical protein